jgi:L-fuconolactonase
MRLSRKDRFYPMQRIDAHQHFWRLSRGDYGWLTPDLVPIYSDFLPDHLAPLLQRHGIDGTVLVQAAPTEAETAFLLSLADENPFVRGVVGWVDFSKPDAPERIARMAEHPKLKGLRPMIQDMADVDWMLRRELELAYQAMVENGLVFDALVLPRHLDNLAILLARHPDMRVVVDHCAKPSIAASGFDAWAGAMRCIGRESSACCKLSGLVTEAGPEWSVDVLRPYVEHVISCFGPERIIWGSDWPVCTLAASYTSWVDASEELLNGCTATDKAAIFGANALRAYAL